MANIPGNLKYTQDHEWVRVEGNRVIVGITEHAANQLGDVVFVEVPTVGKTFSAGEPIGTIESVKAVSEIFSPVSGKVVKVNEELTNEPETVNDDPYNDGWIAEIELSDSKEVAKLMDAAAYEAHVKAGEA